MKNKLIIVISLVAAVLLAILVWYLYFYPHLTKTTPKNNAKNISLPSEIVFTFNQKMALPSLESNASNSLNVAPLTPGSVRIDGKKVIFTPDRDLQYNQTYQVTFINPTTASQHALATATLTFSTKTMPVAQISQLQKDFLARLPIVTSDYSLDYIYTTNSFQVDIGSGNQAEIKKEVEETLRINGFDPDSASVNYYLQPSAGGTAGP
jgi:hypothetical protein